ncbi:Putative glutathione S-transferase, Thioredoxin-like superfamily, glutathione Transferase family [Septoria linicola]|uniref:Glutathione S-transferase, Thioredoxin-like superfamily, glutathione Transferase family n=1 Tax=Septoria linicola TaxID=215465 RepID=A0A9Q9AWN6_9PEZI|nr:putative glutathione S-transferase, Thioredoxin-like superfamily [Septoria linicola]USW53196.1 Putative glutathione S-transferase, Thioredoxin-like superfamily, glutathione Transferase family [Septoria linicola]
MSAESENPSITLYTAQTPNGIKISITLEVLGLPYNVHKLNIAENEQKTEWFRAINPNARIPAMRDTFTDEKEIRLFESGSIMQYLVDRYNTEHRISYPRGTREWVETQNWLFFMNAGVGPMQGQANHFFRYATERIPYAIDRYQTETKRLYGVLDKHLQDADTSYLVGERCTIADIAHWGWIALARWSLGGSHHPVPPLDDSPALKAWEARMFERPAVQRGRQVPDKHQRGMLEDPVAMQAFEARGKAFYQKLAEEAREEPSEDETAALA